MSLAMETPPPPPQAADGGSNLMEATKDLTASISQDAKQAATIIENLKNKIDSFDADDVTDKEGIGLLHLKNLQMVDYMSNLLYVMLKKTHGKSISADDVSGIERIVETRTVLEKMRPMEKKLKYQMDKFTRLADNVETSGDDPLHFKPNLQSLVGDEDEDDDDEEDEEDKVAKDAAAGSKKYVVPKHVPTLPDDELTRQEMEMEASRNAKKKTLSKSIMEDLKRQYMDTPEEEFNQADHMKAKHLAEMRERTRYEEDNYMRLPELSKKEKHKRGRKSMTTVHSVGKELTYFGSNNFFNDGAGGKRKRKSTGSSAAKKGSAKKKFKRRQ